MVSALVCGLGWGKELLLPDPTILLERGTYYLTGTEGPLVPGQQAIFQLWESKDLRAWEHRKLVAGGLLLREGNWGTKWWWAPQLFVHAGRHFLVYCAWEKGQHQLALAVADRVEGPYRPYAVYANGGVGEIDPYVFFDDDGTPYLYFVKFTGGNVLWGQRLSADLKTRVGDWVKCVEVTEAWERKPLPKGYEAYRKPDGSPEYAASAHVTEGPAIFKRHGKYVMLYTANDYRSPDYCVGVAMADTPLGPWRKRTAGPMISRERLGVDGPGHGDVFFEGDKIFYVLHLHNSLGHVGMRRTATIEIAETHLPDGSWCYRAKPETFHVLGIENNDIDGRMVEEYTSPGARD